MNYLSWGFVCFVGIVYLLYNLLPQRWRWKLLLVSSLAFYLCFDVRYLFFLFFVSLSTFKTAKFGRNKRRNKENVIICILLNVGVWFLVKGGNGIWYWSNSLIQMIIPDFQFPLLAVIVPVGISYYVLMAISYVVDVYQKKIKPEKKFGIYLLYLSYFPTIVQGPISKYEPLRMQLVAGKRVNYPTFSRSLLLILVGIIKKMVIADRIAIWANYCFENYVELSGIVLYVGALCYSIQLYMDFSGCVDICRGVSALFGIELIDNFRAPYFSKSIKEFWSKWHISLSTWLKDYIYIPLGGNRQGKLRKYRNLLLTFLVSGIWHGSGLNYLVWGGLHAIYQIIGEITVHTRKKVKGAFKIQEGSCSDTIYRTVITFHLVLFAWIFFRAGRFTNAVDYIFRMFSDVNMWTLFDGSLFALGIDFNQFIVLLFNIGFVVLVDWLKVKGKKSFENYILESHVIIRWGIIILLVFNVIFFGVYGSGYDAAGFLYGGY